MGILAPLTFTRIAVFLYGTFLIPVLCYLRTCRRSLAYLDEQMMQFDCSAAECWDPVDRTLILNEIVRCHGSLADFNDFVRGQLCHRIAASRTGASWPPYFVALAMVSTGL